MVDETIALYHWLAWVADELYGEDARGASRRWALRRLHRDGPMTVAALARIRAVRRQSLKPVIDALARDGLVSLSADPDDARGTRIDLTSAGRTLVDRLDKVDVAVLRSVSRGIREEDLQTTAVTLAALRNAFGTRMRWRPAATAAIE